MFTKVPQKSCKQFYFKSDIFLKKNVIKLLGDFCMKICCQSLSKSSPNIWWLFGYFEKNHLLSKNYYGYFLGNIWKIWATFYFNIWSHCRLDDLASLPYFSSFFRQKQTDSNPISSKNLSLALASGRNYFLLSTSSIETSFARRRKMIQGWIL